MGKGKVMVTIFCGRLDMYVLMLGKDGKFYSRNWMCGEYK